jgi:putative Ca2+/H+ antiporter (TMEM165/GDT1 family)
MLVNVINISIVAGAVALCVGTFRSKRWVLFVGCILFLITASVQTIYNWR